jgi:hypothetical protein
MDGGGRFEAAWRSSAKPTGRAAAMGVQRPAPPRCRHGEDAERKGKRWRKKGLTSGPHM